MKRWIHAATNAEVEIPTLSEYLAEVDQRDIDTISNLMKINTFNGKLLKVPSSRNALGRTTDYSKEDKVIHIVKEGQDYRVYDIPYTDKKFVGVIGIFTYRLTCYDDGSFQFGNGKIRQFGSVSDNTLSNDVYKAMTIF